MISSPHGQLLHGATQRLGQLVGTRGAAAATIDSLEAGNRLLDLHPFDECRYALRIAVATTDERDFANHSLFDGQDEGLRAGALGGVGDGLLHTIDD